MEGKKGASEEVRKRERVGERYCTKGRFKKGCKI